MKVGLLHQCDALNASNYLLYAQTDGIYQAIKTTLKISLELQTILEIEVKRPNCLEDTH